MDDKCERSSFCSKRLALALLSLAALVAWVYWPVRGFGFINYDDNTYILRQPRVIDGLTLANVRWAMRTFYFSNWHPLTWASYFTDAQLWGINPSLMHIENVVLHYLNSALVVFVLAGLTKQIGRSVIVGLLFAVHPMHVESVAWISERKDVLSAFFLLGTIFFYTVYAKKDQPHIKAIAYALALISFALSLSAKAMGITLPAVLLLLDAWPLRRTKKGWAFLLMEKAPMLMLSAVAAGLAVRAQQFGGSVVKTLQVTLLERVGNALIGYVFYVFKLALPSHLSVFYPYVHDRPFGQVFAAAMMLVLISSLAIIMRKSMPSLLVGWLWFLGTLLPVIGLVQVGGQAMADRYSYVPSIGLFIAVVWLISEMCARAKVLWLGTAMAIAVGSVFTIAARGQVQYWKNTTTLFTHAAEVTENNYLAHRLLGDEQVAKGDLAAALNEYERAIAIAPDDAASLANLGVCVSRFDPSQAIPYYRRAIEIDPRPAEYHVSLARALLATGKIDEGLSECRESLKLDPHVDGGEEMLAKGLQLSGANH